VSLEDLLEGGDDDAPTVGGAVVGMLAVWAGVSECFVAACASVWLLATVKSTVFRQMMLVLERALTYIARERTQTYTPSNQPINQSVINLSRLLPPPRR